MHCVPDSLLGRRYYRPDGKGEEGELKDRLERIIEWKKRHRKDD